MALPTLFTPVPKDQSLAYLYGIFGSVNGVIPDPEGGVAGITITLLGELFRQFNTIMLAVGVLIVVYTTVVGIMNTAHEGQFMGKNWNNLWIPIRTVIGIASLVPSASGYSGLQIIMMWVIVQGIGAADLLWNTAIDFKNTHGSIYAQIKVPTLGIKDTMQNLFQGLVCAETAAVDLPNPMGKEDTDLMYYCSSKPGCSQAIRASYDASALNRMTINNTMSFGPYSACGTLTFCDRKVACAGGENTLGCKVCDIQIATLKESIPAMDDIAKMYVALDYIYLSYYKQRLVINKEPKELRPPMVFGPDAKFISEYCASKGDPNCNTMLRPIGNYRSAPTEVIRDVYWKFGLKPVLGEEYENFVGKFVKVYAKAVNDEVDIYLKELRAKSANELPEPLQKARNSGWIMAGSYYFVISSGNSQNITESMPNASYEVIEKTSPLSADPLVKFRNNYEAGSTLVCFSQGGTNCGSMTSGALSGAANGVRDADGVYQEALRSSDTDPLASLIATGSMYLIIAEVIFWIFFAFTIVIGVVAMISSFIGLGFGMGSGISAMAIEMIMVLVPVVMMVVSFLIGLGATLAIYVPLIPFTIFTLGAIGWMISTVEAMVAGPLVALGIISPSGQHEVLGKAEPALGLLFSIFMRPSLMIFGLFAAMLLSSQVMKLGNAGFAQISNSFGAGGMFKAIIVLMTHTSFTVAILNKTFSAIYIIPERVMSWIGIQVPHEGAGELAEVKAGVDKGAQTAGEMGKGMSEVGGKMKDKADQKAGQNKSEAQSRNMSQSELKAASKTDNKDTKMGKSD